MTVALTREQIVTATLAAADAEWQRDVRDRRDSPESLARIDEYIRGSGLGWDWLKEPYRPKAKGQFEWCGAFAAYALRAAGWHPRLALAYGSSTVRLAAYGRYRKATKASSALQRVRVTEAAAIVAPALDALVGRVLPVRELHELVGGVRRFHLVAPNARAADLPWLPEPGDIVLVGPARRRDGKTPPLEVGQHVTICRGLVAGETPEAVLTVEGNGTGDGPGGVRREGVVHAARPFGAAAVGPYTYRVRAVIRPALLDFVPELEFVP